MLKRRHVIVTGVGISVLLAARRAFAAVVGGGAPNPVPVPVLVAWLDTLLPADGPSPAASGIGVPAAFLSLAARSPAIHRLLMEGSLWLDAAARDRGTERFADLVPALRDEVATVAATAPAGSLPARFFVYTRREAFRIYYADARSWPALGYEGPPQPAGFPDFEQPPGEPTHGR